MGWIRFRLYFVVVCVLQFTAGKSELLLECIQIKQVYAVGKYTSGGREIPGCKWFEITTLNHFLDNQTANG